MPQNVLCTMNSIQLNMHSLNRQSLKKLCVESLQWFNDIHQTNINLTPLQIFLNLITPVSTLSDKQSKELRLLLL